MTKEELYVRGSSLNLSNCKYVEVEHLHSLLNKFFESNVCIPKGKNRHPYADVLHELAEDKNSVEFKISEFTKFTNDTSILEFRIKPSEPIYMYQFAYLPMGSTQYEISEYMTEQEAEERFRLMPCEKIEYTKKECK